MKYRWLCPHEWLNDVLISTDDRDKLRSIAQELARRLDDDTLQDIFEKEMDQQGYFETVREP